MAAAESAAAAQAERLSKLEDGEKVNAVVTAPADKKAAKALEKERKKAAKAAAKVCPFSMLPFKPPLAQLGGATGGKAGHCRL
jgi:hypothetical protein